MYEEHKIIEERFGTSTKDDKELASLKYNPNGSVQCMVAFDEGSAELKGRLS